MAITLSSESTVIINTLFSLSSSKNKFITLKQFLSKVVFLHFFKGEEHPLDISNALSSSEIEPISILVWILLLKDEVKIILPKDKNLL